MLAYEVELVAITTVNPGIYAPIGQHTVPVVFDSSIIVVGSSSTHAKPNWRLGCYLQCFTSINGVGNTNFYSGLCPFGLQLFKIQRPSELYRIKLAVPRWHKQLEVAIWKYLGAEELQPIQLVENIEQGIYRIEGKLDAFR